MEPTMFGSRITIIWGEAQCSEWARGHAHHIHRDMGIHHWRNFETACACSPSTMLLNTLICICCGGTGKLWWWGGGGREASSPPPHWMKPCSHSDTIHGTDHHISTIYWRWRSCNKLAITSVHGLYDIIYVIIRPRVCSPRARPYSLMSIVYGWGMIAQLTKTTGGSTQVPGFKLSRFGFTC